MKRILISGIGKGLGKALTERLISLDYFVYGILRNPEQLKSFSNEQLEKLCPIVADLADDSAISIIKNVIKKEPISLLINNAGIAGRTLNLINVDSFELKELFDIHCLGAFRVTKAAIDNLLQSENPVILNINSRLGSITEQSKGTFKHLPTSYSYRIGKASQNMLTNCLKDEFGDKIQIHAIHPGRLISDLSQTDADMEPETAAEEIVNYWEGNKFRLKNGIIEINNKSYEW